MIKFVRQHRRSVILAGTPGDGGFTCYGHKREILVQLIERRLRYGHKLRGHYLDGEDVGQSGRSRFGQYWRQFGEKAGKITINSRFCSRIDEEIKKRRR